MAREGHRVAVRNENTVSQASTKEVVTYRTKSEEEAAEWLDKMYKDGYIVSMDYDDETGEFVCIAIK